MVPMDWQCVPSRDVRHQCNHSESDILLVREGTLLHHRDSIPTSTYAKVRLTARVLAKIHPQLFERSAGAVPLQQAGRILAGFGLAGIAADLWDA